MGATESKQGEEKHGNSSKLIYLNPGTSHCEVTVLRTIPLSQLTGSGAKLKYC